MHRTALVLAALVLATSFGITEAGAQNRAHSGVLTCRLSGGGGPIVTSERTATCAFRAWRGPAEPYVGVIRRFGLDVGATRRGKLAWAVFSQGSVAPGSLAGSYVGPAAEASIGAGLGANALVGGSSRSIALQPVSFSQAGLNLAFEVGGFELHACGNGSPRFAKLCQAADPIWLAR